MFYSFNCFIYFLLCSIYTTNTYCHSQSISLRSSSESPLFILLFTGPLPVSIWLPRFPALPPRPPRPSPRLPICDFIASSWLLISPSSPPRPPAPAGFSVFSKLLNLCESSLSLAALVAGSYGLSPLVSVLFVNCQIRIPNTDNGTNRGTIYCVDNKSIKLNASGLVAGTPFGRCARIKFYPHSLHGSLNDDRWPQETKCPLHSLGTHRAAQSPPAGS